tara:strand:- start:438 stop:626 length:189 start_codon:yes stop_codon:yes gene_type:complete
MINPTIKKLSREGLFNVLMNADFFTYEALFGLNKEDLEQISQQQLDLDEIDEIEFIIELEGE